MSPPAHKQPTLSDLAHIAGLSRSTVSAALLADHRVALKTRERVHKLARKVGYVRNAFAAGLATRGRAKAARALSVAIVSHVPVLEEYEYYKCDGIKLRLRELGYEAHHFDICQDAIPSGKLMRMLYHRGFSGVIFDQIYEECSDLYSTDCRHFSLVCAGRTYGQPPCDLIRNSPGKAVALAWQELRRAGYRRAGFVLLRHQPVMLDDSEREGALWICQRNLQPGEQAISPFLGSFSDQGPFEKWFRRHRPDVVVGFNAVNQLWLREMGLRLPKDIAYASLHLLTPNTGIAGVDQRRDELRNKAAEHVDFLIRHRRTGFSEQSLEILGPVCWVPGASLPPRT